MELYFEEDDFEGFLETLRKYPNIQYLGDGVKEQDWGQRSIRLYNLGRQPRENLVQFRFIYNKGFEFCKGVLWKNIK